MLLYFCCFKGMLYLLPLECLCKKGNFTGVVAIISNFSFVNIALCLFVVCPKSKQILNLSQKLKWKKIFKIVHWLVFLNMLYLDQIIKFLLFKTLRRKAAIKSFCGNKCCKMLNNKNLFFTVISFAKNKCHVLFCVLLSLFFLMWIESTEHPQINLNLFCWGRLAQSGECPLIIPAI